MFQIDNSTAATALPTPAAAGAPGFFTDGNAALAVPATIVPADWFNMVQQELLAVVLAGGLTPDKENQGQLLAAIESLFAGRQLNTQIFSSSGTYTATPGTKRVRVRAIGAGGAGGGSSATSAAQVSVGGGGAAGSFAEAIYTTGFSGQVVTIGAAGTGNSGLTGNAGGTTSFGALLVCPGGNGGSSINNSTSAGFNGGSPGTPGASPTGSGITVRGAGQPGALGLTSGSFAYSGAGAPSVFGGGGVGSNSGVVNPGSAPGSGGSGASSVPSAGASAGAAGAAGIVIIEEFA